VRFLAVAAVLALLVLLALLSAARRIRHRVRLDEEAGEEARQLASDAEFDRAARLTHEGVVDPRPSPTRPGPVVMTPTRPPTRHPLNHEGEDE
jgi:hypothetical protein